MVEMKNIRYKKRETYKSPVVYYNSYWVEINEDKNTMGKASESSGPNPTRKEIQNNHKQKEKDTQKRKIQK